MKSIWSETVEFQKRGPLRGDRQAEVVVIGAGIAGILTAYFLKQKGFHVTVLEADRICSGQTKGTTAKITAQHYIIYQDLIRIYGEEKARHYAKLEEWAIGEYERLIRERKIDCDFERCSAYLYSCIETERLEKEAEAAGILGIQADLKTECELPFPVKGALEFKDQAKFHPLKFIKGIEKELVIYEKTLVREVRSESTGKSRVIAEHGSITADHVVFACHFPFVNIPGYYFARMHQSRSYVLAIKNAEELQGCYLSIDPDGYSFRSEGRMLLFGGGSHRTGENECGGRYAMLKKKAEELWPGSKEVYRWSAQDCMTLDHVPYIGRYSRRKENWYVATGFGKWGMTSSMVSAKILSAMIAGEELEEADIFSPQRKIPFAASGELLKNGAVTVKNLVSIKKTSRCPHMGCKLSWNPDENSWDCPCHGSRFEKAGKLIHNPALKDIDK